MSDPNQDAPGQEHGTVGLPESAQEHGDAVLPAGAARQVSMDRLARVSRGFGLDEHAVTELTGAFAAMTEPWGAAPATDLPPSDVSSDGSPVEFAVDLDETRPAVQFAVEPLPIDGTRDGASAAARRMMSMLVKRYGADDTRWRAVADLYLPERPARDHVAMYGAEIARDRPLGFKVWFYPGVAGEQSTGELLRRGLERLGMPAAWDAVRAHTGRGLRTDLPVLISLDLTADSSARVKVYFRHYDIGADALAELMGRQPGFEPGRISELCRRVVGGDDLGEQPPVSCLTFTADQPGRVRAATLYLPLWTYAPDDDVIRVRVGRLLRDQGRSPAAYHRGLEHVAGRPLDGGRGIHNYLSWQPGRHGPRFKVYWSPELRHINPPARYRHEGPPASARPRVRP